MNNPLGAFFGQDRFIPLAGPCASTYTLVGAKPRTARTHQIRVHLASMGHLVVGQVYGRRRSRLPVTRQSLHAWRPEFEHLLAGQRIGPEILLASI